MVRKPGERASPALGRSRRAAIATLAVKKVPIRFREENGMPDQGES